MPVKKLLLAILTFLAVFAVVYFLYNNKDLFASADCNVQSIKLRGEISTYVLYGKIA